MQDTFVPTNEMRTEKDALGEVLVPATAYWGAQTERSRHHFPTDGGTMPREVIYALARIKKAAAQVNVRRGVLDERRASLIDTVCEEILQGKLDTHFPLSIWQTGSGTQTNMNVNEVIAHRGNVLAGEALLHPNDHVNRSQSSNDVFPAAMNIAAREQTKRRLLPALTALIASFRRIEEASCGIIKTGRTHLQDATPLTAAQEISAWRVALEEDEKAIRIVAKEVEALPLGGTAVGTGLNAPKGYDEAMCKALSSQLDLDFTPLENKFYGLSMKSPLTRFHGALKSLAADLNKIANDIRFLSCGPRCGIGEYRIPANEPGSSIMPGKVNPTQVESITMIALQVMGNDVAVGMAAASGQMQLNTYMPLIIHNVLTSERLLASGMDCFRQFLVDGLQADAEKMGNLLRQSLMLVTALAPHIGYDAASKIAHTAHERDITLKEAALESGLISEEAYDRLVDPAKMV